MTGKVLMFPVVVDLEIVEKLKLECRKKLQRGHSRRKCDTPKRSDPNQLRWALVREFGPSFPRHARFEEQLRLLLRLGYVELKQDSRGRRFRPIREI